MPVLCADHPLEVRLPVYPRDGGFPDSCRRGDAGASFPAPASLSCKPFGLDIGVDKWTSQ